MIPRRRLLQIGAALPAAWALRASPLPAAGAPLTGPRTVPGAGLAGLSLSWRGPAAQPSAVRARTATGWRPWVVIEPDHGHGPEDPTGRTHGPAVLVPGAEAYEIAPGSAADLQYHPIDARPGRGAGTALDASAQAIDDGDPLYAGLRFEEPLPGLRIIDRANWTDVGRRDTVDCSIPSSVFGLGCRADVGLRHGVVHHTVNDNDYAAGRVADLLWGIQRFHMETRGWDDIGYNFVVDRFGRVWHAREGDIREPISAGHTLGLNAESVGVAVLGTFTASAVPDAVVDALGMLLGWKLSLHGVDPAGRTSVRSTGGDFAERGEFVEVDNISGHRDNQQTGCPGTRLYDRLGEVRAIATDLVPVFGHLTPSYALDRVDVDGWAIDRANPTEPTTVEIIVDGGEPLRITADAAVDGLGDRYPAAGEAHGFSSTVPIDLDTTSIVVRVGGDGPQPADLMDLTLFATFIDVEPHRFFAPGVRFLRETEITTGTVPGLFEPMDRVTRGQMATFLHRFMGRPEATTPPPFTDLAPGAFYADAVAWLHEAEITVGTTTTTFSPEEFVTRGQMATFLWRLCGRPAAGGPPGFLDVPDTAYYATAVAWMAGLGLTTGVSPTRFAPLQSVTRGEMATFLLRLASTPEAWTEVDPPAVVTFPVEDDQPVDAEDPASS